MKRKSDDSVSPPGSPETRGYKRRKQEKDGSPSRGNPKGKDVDDGGADDDGDDDEAGAMAEDDYTAQLSWQSQSKENLHVLMQNFTPEQHDRYDQYRRSAINKNTVRKFINHTLGTNPSMNVAQVVAGFSKVFVGEMVERARAIQALKGDTGPLAPDHLREAYRKYLQETGAVGAARPLRGKKLFAR